MHHFITSHQPKKRRKVLRGEKKKKSDKHFFTEVKSYEAGGF